MSQLSYRDGYKTYPNASSALGTTHTCREANPRNMDHQGDRLKQAIAETGYTMAEVCERFGWSYNTVKSNANGNASFSFKKAMVYAARLKVRAEWLYAGTLPIRDASKPIKLAATEVPLIGWVKAGELGDITMMHDLAEVETAITDNLGPGEWFATEVVGDSMDRVSPEGSRIFVNTVERVPVSGGYYLFSLRGETTFKRYYDDPVQRLEPFSTNPMNKTIFLDKKESWVVIGRVHRSVLDLN